MADKKQIFINEIEYIIESVRKTTGEEPLSADARTYFEALKICEDKSKSEKAFTQNGLLILKFMQDNKDTFNNLFKAKDFEAIGITSRAASGAIRKLVTDGYCEKLGEKPTIYSLTGKGTEISLPEE